MVKEIYMLIMDGKHVVDGKHDARPENVVDKAYNTFGYMKRSWSNVKADSASAQLNETSQG
ncbi:hypothetical protein CHS0354_027229, partial [Potamilus streckersoni]